MFKNKILNWIFIVFMFVLVSYRLVELHCFPDSRVIAQSKRQYWLQVPFSASRGNIVDRNSIILALSIPTYSCFADPSLWNDEDTIKLKKYLSSEGEKKLKNKKNKFLWLFRKLDENKAEEIKAQNISGLHWCIENARLYPNNFLLNQVIGFCDNEGFGLSGIEFIMNDILYIPSGLRFYGKSFSGNNLEFSKIKNKSELNSVKLSLDSKMQYYVENILEQEAISNNAKWGAVVCIEVKTGAIRSMASWPYYNLNNRYEITNTKFFINNAIGRTYEPGSTLKPIICGIALDKGIIRKDTSFFCPQKMKIADGYISDHSANGILDLKGVIVKSSNVGMAQIGKSIKPSEMYNSLCEWGFGKALSLELNGVEEGLIASPELWRGVIPANIAIGQGLAVTPLQLVTAISAIANEGVLLQPYLVYEAMDTSGRVVYRGEKRILRNVLSRQNALWISNAMREVVTSGTGKSANSQLVEVAGKTGTAEVAGHGSYLEGKWVSSFVGFWPWKSPMYAMIVIIGEPSKGKYYGAEVAAPVFRRIVEETWEFTYGKDKIL
jgi:cell division protein FtsI (penicillin-binding protein 3)/stage V sporulation protein D (sporulation-specific penicillin-binding protein)